MISLIFLLSFAIVPAIMINNGKPVLRHHDEDRLIFISTPRHLPFISFTRPTADAVTLSRMKVQSAITVEIKDIPRAFLPR